MLQIAIVFLVLVSLSSAKHVRFRRQFPCDHFLRITYPEYFTHCDCIYSEWSEWGAVEGSTRSVAVSQCESGEMYTEQRTRSSIGTNCNDIREIRQICVPDAVDRLILSLGLGGSGQDYSTIGSPEINIDYIEALAVVEDRESTQQKRSVEKRNLENSQLTKSSMCKAEGQGILCPIHNLGREIKVCKKLTQTAQSRGKRSTLQAAAGTQNVENRNLHKLPLVYDGYVIPFSHKEHGYRFRRRAISPDVCAKSPNLTQYVLYVLDSSGSINEDNFDRIKIAVANLTTLFCKRVKFALMTFSSNLRQEFCFDCFENNICGRSKAAEHIKAAKYQGHLTYTGEAARCICDEFLDSLCGIDEDPSCLDVVFITDGQSNGRLDVCTEVSSCLHSKTGINTYAIGIGNYNKTEVDCITDGNGQRRYSAFEFEDLNAFEAAIREVRLRLLLGGDQFACAALYGPAPSPTQIPAGKNPN